MKSPRVLVGCPVHEIKRYSIERWIEAAGRFNPKASDILMVDNSPGGTVYDDFHNLIPMVRLSIEPEATAHTRIARSMDLIRRYALSRGFDYWLSIECDVIAPFNTIATMLQWAEQVPAVWYSMPCPGRNNPVLFTNNFCCALLTRGLLEQIDFQRAPEIRCADGWLHLLCLDRGWFIATNPPVQLDLQHMANPDPEREVKW